MRTDAWTRGPGRCEVHCPADQRHRKKYYQFTAIDDCTRLRVLRIYDRLNQKTAIAFADFLLDKFPFRVEVIQTDIQEVNTAQTTVVTSTARTNWQSGGTASVCCIRVRPCLSSESRLWSVPTAWATYGCGKRTWQRS